MDEKITLDDEVIVQFARDAWYEIFGFRHEAYLHPDEQVPHDKERYLYELHASDYFTGGIRPARTTSLEAQAMMASWQRFMIKVDIAERTGTSIPLTPAAVTRARAGRSTPYPRSSSSGSSWWTSPNWGSWSWSDWSGRNWWS